MSTGPQTYPGASKAHWFQDDYPGDAQEVNVVVLHTTEGRTLPDYDGGAVAPNLTAVPDFAAKKLRWYQHFDFDRSSRALVNLRGGVETNTLNVSQVELVGTCDPATHAKWTKSGYQHIYWPQAPDWALRGVAAFLAWAHSQHGVPLTGPKTWKAYPGSYGASNGVRFSFDAWEDFTGICGHQHAPENLHGDPGAINFARILELAKATGSTPTTPGYQPFPGAGWFRKLPNSSIVTAMGKRLVAVGYKGYAVGPGAQWTEADRAAYAWWQRKLGYTGSAADGWPGAQSWAALKVPRVG